MRNGTRSRLIWPVENRVGRVVYLSTGQRQLLTYVSSQMRHGRHSFTVDQLARVVGIDRSNVSRGLDRLASMQIIGRRSTRGPLGRTITWPLKRRTSPALHRRTNVATSTSFGGYLTRERWKTAVSNGEDGAVRRLTPPRLLYGRCAAGHSVRLIGWHRIRRPSTDPAIARFLEGRWSGKCRRCTEVVTVAERVAVPASRRLPGWSRVGDFGLIRGQDGHFTVAHRANDGGSP